MLARDLRASVRGIAQYLGTCILLHTTAKLTAATLFAFKPRERLIICTSHNRPTGERAALRCRSPSKRR